MGHPVLGNFGGFLLAGIFRASPLLLGFGLGIGVPLIPIALLDLIPEYFRRQAETRNQLKVEHFFGKKCFEKNEGFHLVSAEREIAPEFLDRLYAKGAPDDKRDDVTKRMKALPEGVRSCSPSRETSSRNWLTSIYVLVSISIVVH